MREGALPGRERAGKNSRHSKREQRCNKKSNFEMSVGALGGDFNISQRTSQADSASGDGYRYVEHLGVIAAAGLCADRSAQSRDKLGLLSFVLERAHRNLRVGNNSAIHVNDCCACDGGLTFLRSDDVDAVGVVGVHSRREHARLLRQVARDFVAKSIFPMRVQKIEEDHADHRDDQPR